MTQKQTGLLLADDHTMMTNALAQSLQEIDGLSVLACCTDGNKALQFLNGHSREVNVAVFDIHMPHLDGLSATPIVKTRFPHIKVIILSMYYNHQIIDQVKSCGADAFVHKSDELERLVQVIGEVMSGKKVFPNYDATLTGYTNEVAEDAFLKISVLSEREKQIARHIRDGLTTPKIAKLLTLSEYTVDTHRKNIIQKLGLKSTADLIRFATENKL